MNFVNTKAEVKKRKMSVTDKCFGALFVSLIILVAMLITSMVCIKFNIGLFGSSIFTSIVLLKFGIILNFAILGISLLVITIKN